MICGWCFPLFLFVCCVCIVEIFVLRVSSLQSLTLGTSVLLCGLFEQEMSTWHSQTPKVSDPTFLRAFIVGI